MICARTAASLRRQFTVSGPLTSEIPYGMTTLPCESCIWLPTIFRLVLASLPARTGPHAVGVFLRSAGDATASTMAPAASTSRTAKSGRITVNRERRRPWAAHQASRREHGAVVLDGRVDVRLQYGAHEAVHGVRLEDRRIGRRAAEPACRHRRLDLLAATAALVDLQHVDAAVGVRGVDDLAVAVGRRPVRRPRRPVR